MAESYEIGPNSTPQSRLVLHAQIRLLCAPVSPILRCKPLKAPHMHAASVNMNSFHPHCIAYLVPQPVSLHHRTRFSRHSSLIPPSNPFCLRFRARTHRCHRGFYLDSRVQHFTGVSSSPSCIFISPLPVFVDEIFVRSFAEDAFLLRENIRIISYVLILVL